MFMDSIDFTSVFTQLGLSLVFLYLLITLWKDHKLMIKEKDEQIEKKDEIIVALLKDMSGVFQQNIQAITELKNAVENNTCALQYLTSNLDPIILEEKS